MGRVSSIEHADMVLLVLGAATEDPEQQGKCAGITRLEKLTFLLQSETKLWDVAAVSPDAFVFKPYHYGPYTRELYDAVDLLVGIGLVREERVHSKSGVDQGESLEVLDPRDVGIIGGSGPERYVERVFDLTDKGRYIAGVLAKRIGDDAMNEISRVKNEYGTMPLRELLRIVYERHPEMTVRSRIKDQF